jgi:hypothetical protein
VGRLPRAAPGALARLLVQSTRSEEADEGVGPRDRVPPHKTYSSLTVTFSAAPWPAADCNSTSPPRALARFRMLTSP